MALRPLLQTDSANARGARSLGLATHPLDPTALTCPSSLRRKGGAWRLAAGTRGLGGGNGPPLLITPPPLQSSSAPDAPRHTHTRPSLGECPAAAPDLLHFASALGERGRRSTSTRGRCPRRAGQIAASQAGRGAVRTAGCGAELARPQSLLARRLGPDWLAASGKRDLGQNGWHPHSIKTRLRMDSGIPQSGAARGAGPARGRGAGEAQYAG